MLLSYLVYAAYDIIEYTRWGGKIVNLGLMSIWTFFYTIASVVLRRCWFRSEPIVPSWSLPMEILVEIIRGNLLSFYKLYCPKTSLPKQISIIRHLASNPIPVPNFFFGVIPAQRFCIPNSLTPAASPIEVEWFVPKNYHDSPHSSGGTVLYLHGGAYIVCNIDTHRPMIASVATKCHCRVLAVNYGLAPERPFPAGLYDALSSYKWLIDHRKISPSNITIMGDSAGGGLAFATLLAIKARGWALPGKLVGFSPWVDLSCNGASWKTNADKDYLQFDPNHTAPRCYTNGASLTDPLVSPINGDYRGITTKILIQSGTIEVLHDEAVLLTRKLKDNTVNVTFQALPDMPHAFQFIPRASWSKAASDGLTRFMASPM